MRSGSWNACDKKPFEGAISEIGTILTWLVKLTMSVVEGCTDPVRGREWTVLRYGFAGSTSS